VGSATSRNFVRSGRTTAALYKKGRGRSFRTELSKKRLTFSGGGEKRETKQSEKTRRKEESTNNNGEGKMSRCRGGKGKRTGTMVNQGERFTRAERRGKKCYQKRNLFKQRVRKEGSNFSITNIGPH